MFKIVYNTFKLYCLVDGSGAGSGNLEILVNGGHVTSFVRNLGNQKFLASFVPHKALIHLVDMKFNNEQVPGNNLMYLLIIVKPIEKEGSHS